MGKSSNIRKERFQTVPYCGNPLEKDWIPRIKYPVSSTGQAKAGSIKSGMTKCVK
jgi:hypothetical protein